MKRILICTLLCLSILLSLTPRISAVNEEAEDISASTTISGSGYTDFSFLKDKKIKTYRTSEGDTHITLQNEAGIHGIYLLFDLEPGEYLIENPDTGVSIPAGQYGFLHEYIDLASAFSQAPTAITLRFSKGGIRLSEIYAFSAGATPSFVQKWQTPLDGKTDVLLLSTHGDDEQLYFAGLLPYYAGQRKVNVQVVYLTDHRNTTMYRTHEMLNGLWGVGVTAYPVFGRFPDIRIDNLANLYARYKSMGVHKNDFLEFVVENLRRFKPKVVVGHDVNGEYGHGMHKLYTECLMEALPITSAPEQFPASAKEYGTWDVPKAYLHLYKQNPIVMDYDVPLSEFNGLTAFQVTQKYGFSAHTSQHGYSFYPWIYGKNGEITKASQIKTYNPCHFGLYRTLVGDDVNKNDFLENVTTHHEDYLIEQERLEQERLEQERLEQERLEQERLEQERLEQERLEQERLEQERLEQERLERERLAAEQKKQKIRNSIIVLVALCIALGATVLILIKRKHNAKHRHSGRNRSYPTSQ